MNIENPTTLGRNDQKIGHLGQVCTLCIFSHQTLRTALDGCLDHFQSKKMSKYHIVTSYLITIITINNNNKNNNNNAEFI